ncbi:TPA: hypothetical protein ACH3X1_016789 [Trebouxia sp. C0004]
MSGRSTCNSQAETNFLMQGMIIKEIEKWGGTRFAAIVTDNASNMQKTRRLVLKRCPHMIEVRCMMHAFSTTMASVMGHKYATTLITCAQRIVTFFRASHQPLALLKKLAANMGIKRMLITSNKTRFTSVHASLESVVRLQNVLQEIAQQHAALLSAATLAIIKDDMFCIRLKQICKLLEPFSLVIAAVQSAKTTLADVMRYWLFLAKQVTGSSSELLPADFKAHCFMAYNMRHEEMLNPLCKLALFLHPLYHDAVSASKANWIEVQQTAGNLWHDGYKKQVPETQQLMEDIKRYKIHDEPFASMPVDGELETLRLYWRFLASSGDQLQLPLLALLMLDIKPHAADPEKTVSLMGWFHSAGRSQLLSRITTTMTTVKMHYQTVKDRVVKPLRTLEDIMVSEQELAAVADKDKTAEADVVISGPLDDDPTELTQQLQQGPAVNAANAMELCSTAELVDLFAEYYEDDLEQRKDNFC